MPAGSRSRSPLRGPSPLGELGLAALQRTLHAQVIPRLVQGRLAANAASGGAGLAEGAAPLDPRDAEQFLLEILADRPPARYETLDKLRRRGLGVEEICLGLFAPVASRLGTMWAEDRCDFTNVTVVVGRLHRLLRDLAADSGEAPGPCGLPLGAPRALLAQPPNEQHMFGLSMVAEFLRRAGWEVLGGVGGAVTDPAARVQVERVDLVGLSVGSDNYLDWARETIWRIRQSSVNAGVHVVLGGPIFVSRQALALELGADGSARDAREAVELANRLAGIRLPAPAVAALRGAGPTR